MTGRVASIKPVLANLQAGQHATIENGDLDGEVVKHNREWILNVELEQSRKNPFSQRLTAEEIAMFQLCSQADRLDNIVTKLVQGLTITIEGGVGTVNYNGETTKRYLNKIALENTMLSERLEEAIMRSKQAVGVTQAKSEDLVLRIYAEPEEPREDVKDAIFKSLKPFAGEGNKTKIDEEFKRFLTTLYDIARTNKVSHEICRSFLMRNLVDPAKTIAKNYWEVNFAPYGAAEGPKPSLTELVFFLEKKFLKFTSPEKALKALSCIKREPTESLIQLECRIIQLVGLASRHIVEENKDFYVKTERVNALMRALGPKDRARIAQKNRDLKLIGREPLTFEQSVQLLRALKNEEKDTSETESGSEEETEDVARWTDTRGRGNKRGGQSNRGKRDETMKGKFKNGMEIENYEIRSTQVNQDNCRKCGRRGHRDGSEKCPNKDDTLTKLRCRKCLLGFHSSTVCKNREGQKKPNGETRQGGGNTGRKPQNRNFARNVTFDDEDDNTENEDKDFEEEEDSLNLDDV